jgi:hypothetical protein
VFYVNTFGETFLNKLHFFSWFMLFSEGASLRLRRRRCVAGWLRLWLALLVLTYWAIENPT